MKKHFQICVFALLVLIFALSGCDYYHNYQQREPLFGVYHSFFAKTFTDDGLRGVAEFSTTDCFSNDCMESDADISITFFFSDNIEFSNLTLNYKWNVCCDWQLSGNELSLNVDTSSIDYQFVSSSATRYIEQTMVRYLRKYIGNEVKKTIENGFAEHYGQSMKIVELTDSIMTIERNGELMSMLRERD